MWNLSSLYGADYGLIPIGYQAISWTSPGNLIIYTHEWSYIGVPNRMQYIHGLVQDYSNSIANALEFLQSCSYMGYISGHTSCNAEDISQASES